MRRKRNNKGKKNILAMNKMTIIFFKNMIVISQYSVGIQNPKRKTILLGTFPPISKIPSSRIHFTPLSYTSLVFSFQFPLLLLRTAGSALQISKFSLSLSKSQPLDLLRGPIASNPNGYLVYAHALVSLRQQGS